jgi:hypothetical protein
MVERILPFFQRGENALRCAGQPKAWPDDRVLCRLSSSAKDALSLADAKTGVLITGQTGKGKTSGPGRLLANAYLRAGFGGLVLCAKIDEADLWRKYLRETGREADCIFFGESPAHSFNFLSYESKVSGADLEENIVNLMIEVARITNPQGKGGENEEFWQSQRKKLLRNIVGLLLPVDGNVDLLRMNAILNSAPQDLQQARAADWRNSSALFKYLVRAEQLIGQRIREHEYRLIADYWLHEHPSTDTRTRSNVIADYTGLLDAFLRGKIYDIFCKATTVSPDEILAGKIVVVALPVAAYHEVGRYAAAIWKYLLQRASQRRKLDHPESIRPSFIWADEAQYFSSPADQIFQTVARSYRICTVFLTQNLPNYYVEFGGHEAGVHRVHSLLGNLAIKFFCGNDDTVTNEWASKTIDKTVQYRVSLNGAQTGEGHSIGLSQSEEFDCPSRNFIGLRHGTKVNDYVVEAIAFQSGRRWSNGRSWMKCSFKQTA